MQIESLWQADVQQRIFRTLVTAFAHPGEPGALGAGALRSVLATLLDGATTLADPHGLIETGDWPLLLVQRGTAGDARYVVADGRRAPDFQPALGTLESPEFGATLLLKVARLGGGDQCLALSGPGIAGTHELRLAGLHPGWLEQRGVWVAHFPLGVDLLLLDDTQVVALPRSTRIIIGEGA